MGQENKVNVCNMTDKMRMYGSHHANNMLWFDVSELTTERSELNEPSY